MEGRDIAIDARWADHKADRLAALAAEVALAKPEIVVTHSSAGVLAARKVAAAIPIVFATAASPVEQGFVASLQRPGGNITGVVIFGPDLVQKLVEIAREAFPAARRIAVLIHDPDPVHKLTLTRFEPAARRFGFEPLIGRFTRPDDIEAVFGRLSEQKVEAAIISQQAFFTSNRRRIIEQSLKARLPLLSASNVIVEGGGLLGYGTQTEENYRRAATLVDRILRGAKPGNLPVEQPERFQLVVNRKTAKLIGVELSPLTMLRADRVID